VTTPTTFATAGGANSLTIDPGAGYLFRPAALSVNRANLVGSGATTIFSGPGSFPPAIDVDEVNQRVAWLDPDLFQVRSVSYTGPGVSAQGGFMFIDGLDYDAVNGAVYMSTASLGAIYSYDITLGNETLLLSGLDQPRGFAVHSGNQEIYWVDGAGMLQRASSTGAGLTTLGLVNSSASNTTRLQIDENAGHIYMTNGSTID